jgi:YD repeat-containing protein
MGNAIEMIYPDGSKIKQTFDIAGRLKVSTNKRNQQALYSYDADGRMIKKSTPEGNVLFSYDDKDRVTDIQAADYRYEMESGILCIRSITSTRNEGVRSAIAHHRCYIFPVIGDTAVPNFPSSACILFLYHSHRNVRSLFDIRRETLYRKYCPGHTGNRNGFAPGFSCQASLFSSPFLRFLTS